MRFTDLIREIHRRSLWQVLGIYLVAGWIAIQVVQTLTESLGLPEWFPALAVTLLIVGLPVVLATAFVQEGVRRRGDEADPSSQTGGAAPVPAAVAPSGARRLLTWRRALGGGVLAFALWGVVAAGWLVFRPGTGGLEPDASRSGARSIAVLPFENMSGDEASEPFVVGVHDDILTQLSKIGALQVTSRSSVLEYRNSAKPIREIAGELGVETVLEGGIQRAGQRVRINVQLIDAGTDRHLWAETYDRELSAENIFDIQSEIARSIARALEAKLTPEEETELAEAPTRSVDALDHYHRGVFYLDRRGDWIADSLAVAMLERATELDPNFVEAWATLTVARSWLVRQGTALSDSAAQAALERTRELAPNAVEALLASGYYHYYGRGDYSAALADFKAAEARRPNDSDVLRSVGLILRRLGRWEESIAYSARAAEVDPRGSENLVDLSASYWFTRQFDEAMRNVERALLVSPEYESARRQKFDLLLWTRGDTTHARAFADSSRGMVSQRLSASWRAQLAWLAREPRRAIPALQTANSDRARGVTPYYFTYDDRLAWLALLHHQAGEKAASTAYADSMLLRAATIPIRPAGARDLFGQRAAVELYRGLAYALKEDAQRAVEAGERAAELFPVSYDAIDGTSVLTELATIYTLVGEQERAIDTLERLLSIPSDMTVTRLRLDPFYDPLRDNPRFQALLVTR